MTLSVNTQEADRLARELTQLTGESLDDAVTRALAERLDRERIVRQVDGGSSARILAHAARLRARYDMRPVTRQEWDAGWGEEE